MRADAARVLAEAKALDSLPLDANWLYSATALGIQLAHLGDADAAAAVYPRLLPYRDRRSRRARERLQRVGRALAGPARGDARRPTRRAVAHLEEAVRRNDELGASPFAAAARRALARAGRRSTTAPPRCAVRRPGR